MALRVGHQDRMSLHGAVKILETDPSLSGAMPQGTQIGEVDGPLNLILSHASVSCFYNLMPKKTRISIIEGGPELLPRIRTLWEALRDHHAVASKNFGQHIGSGTFAKRKRDLLRKSDHGRRLHVVIALHDLTRPIGYSVSTIDPLGLGELDSLFVSDEFRGLGVGELMVKPSLHWLDRKRARDIVIHVAVGNERALPFYAKCGFVPYTWTLRRKPASR